MGELDTEKLDKLQEELQNQEELFDKSCLELGKKYYLKYGKNAEPDLGEDVEVIDRLFARMKELKQRIALERGKAICPACQEETEKEDRFCPHCGARMPQEEIKLDENETACPQCGQVMAKTCKFCVKCGHKMQTDSTEIPDIKTVPAFNRTEPEKQVKEVLKNCPKCGAEVEADMKFCMTCGQRLR